MNYEQKLKNYLNLNKCQNELKHCERNYDKTEIKSNDNLVNDSSGRSAYIKEQIKRKIENRLDHNSTNYMTRCTEKNNESEMCFDDSMKIEMRNYKRLIEDCLDFDLPNVKNTYNLKNFLPSNNDSYSKFLKKYEKTIAKTVNDLNLQKNFFPIETEENSLTFLKDNSNEKKKDIKPVSKKKLPSPIKLTKNFQNKHEEEFFCEYEYDSQISKNKAPRKESNTDKHIHIDYVCVDCKNSRVKKKRAKLNHSKIFFEVYVERAKSESEENKSQSDTEGDYLDNANEEQDDIAKLNIVLENKKHRSNYNPSEELFNYNWYCLDYVENPTEMKTVISKFLNFEN